MKFSKKQTGFIAGIFFAAGLISGCGDGGGSGVAYMNFNDNDAFGGLIKDSFTKGAQSKGLNVTFYDAKGDVNTQIDQMKEAMANGVQSVVLVAADGELIVPVVEQANEAGITIITVNRDIKGGERIEVLSDDYEAGKLQADYMVKNLPQGAQIVYLEGTATQSSAQNRWEGFKKECLDKRADIKLLDMQDGDYSKSEGMKIMSLWLSLFPKIDAVICGNDQMALGAVEALKASGRLQGCLVSGVDAVDDALKAIKAGEMVQTIKQDAVKQGEGAADIAAQVAGGAKPGNLNVPFTSITKENIAQFAK